MSRSRFYVGDIEDPEFMNAFGEGPFNFIVMSDTIGALDDCEITLELLHRFCTPETRIVIAYYSNYWEPIIRIGEIMGLKMPNKPQNYLSTDDIVGLMNLANIEVMRREWRQLLPSRLLGLGILVNRYLATLPGIRRLCLRNYVVGRPMPRANRCLKSATVVVPCRNERDNVESAVTRMPEICDDLEILFV